MQARVFFAESQFNRDLHVQVPVSRVSKEVSEQCHQVKGQSKVSEMQ
jgi:hypothetical protein